MLLVNRHEPGLHLSLWLMAVALEDKVIDTPRWLILKKAFCLLWQKSRDSKRGGYGKYICCKSI